MLDPQMAELEMLAVVELGGDVSPRMIWATFSRGCGALPKKIRDHPGTFRRAGDVRCNQRV
jgi:hypothetical protein